MKQDVIAFLWPALVGVLAAALILDKWVLEPGEALTNTANRYAFRCEYLHGEVSRRAQRSAY